MQELWFSNQGRPISCFRKQMIMMRMQQKCDGIHREAKADHMCKQVRQFEFRRVHTDPYKALSKLGEAANNATD